MSQPGADRNLLFGMLALQMDFITREQLIAGMQAWVFDKSKPLGDILIKHNALAEDNRALIEALVQKHLAMHNNDAEKSLAAVSSVESIKKDLEKIQDDNLQASVLHLSVTKQKPVDIYATVPPPSVGLSTSSGSRFRILRPHARGGLGEVYVAKDEELHREVALKEIQDRHADNIESRSRFLLEAEITGGLEHPGIVPVYGLGAYADGRPYYAMRFIRGDSLKDAIDRFHKAEAGMSAGERTLELRSLLGRFIDVCNAIDYAHSRGVLHRDLKPGNIMLGKHGETLVVDWGLAKPLGAQMPSQATEPGEGSLVPSISGSTGSQTMMGSAVGTPQFMSPEQAAGRLDQLGPPSDVYSLGATLFCLLGGQAPVSDTDVAAVLNKVQRGEIRRLRDVKPNVPLPLEAICVKAMALKPADRYATPRLLADDLEHWLADEPVSAWREPWTVKARRWIGRHRTLVTGVSAAVVVALVFLTVMAILLNAAKDRETAAKELAQKNEKEAIEQKEKAERNFKLARQAVDRYHTEVSESVLLNEPGMEPLRKKLLLAAKEFYEKFVHERAGDKSVQGDLGKATYRLAQITADIGDPRAAIALHKQAVEIFEPLTASKEGLLYQADLAATLQNLGRLYRLTDQLSRSEESYEEALDLWHHLLKLYPKDETDQAGVARTELGLGNYYRITRRLANARKHYERAQDGWTALANAHPSTAAYQRELALCQNNVGTVYRGLGDHEAEAAKLFATAAGIQKKLVDQYPNITQYQNDLARSNFNLGSLYASIPNDAGRAEAPFQEAIRLWQALVDRNPAVTEFHDNLAQAYTALALVYRQKQDTKNAVDACRKALAIERKLADNQKDSARYQSDVGRGCFTLGEIYRTSGQTDKALAAYEDGKLIQEKLTRKLPDVPQYQAELARTCNSLGLLYAKTMKEDKAQASYKEALALWEKLTQKYSEDQEFASGYIGTCLDFGNMVKADGNLKDALALATRAVETVDAKTVTHLANMPVRVPLFRAYKMRAEIFTALGRFPEALQDWDSVFVLARDKEKPGVQLLRLAAMARAGKYQEATYEAGPLLAKATGGYSQYGFAAVYSLAAGAASTDEKLPAAERVRLADQYAAEAMKLLTSARDGGYFQTPAIRAKLQTDPDLRALRARPEFKKLAGNLPK